MNEKIISVYFDRNGLPYKDRELTCHFPIVGSGFLGASNTTKIRFYFDQIGNSNTTWVAVAKLPNGKQGSKVLSVSVDSELNENYAELQLDSWFTQAKGDVYIALQGYQGGVEYSYDSESELYEITGTPTIQTTGSIKLAINYAPIGQVADYNDEFTTYQEILAALGDKADITSTIIVVNDIAQVVATTYEDGQIFYNLADRKLYQLDNSSFVVFQPYVVISSNPIPESDFAIILAHKEYPIMNGGYVFWFYEENTSVLTYIRNNLNVSSNTFTATKQQLIIFKNTREYNLFTEDAETYKKTKIDTELSGKADKSNTYTKTEVDEAISQAISSAYKYKGSVSTYEDLPTSANEVGDVYNVEDTGDNYAWTGSYWDKLSGTVDLSDYVTDSELATALSSKQDTINSLNKLESDLVDDTNQTNKFVTSTEKSIWNSKQNALVSGQTIKTINNESLLGSGNINVSGDSAEWGSIGGDIDDQTDLQNELQNLREIAEGKCKTYVLSYQTTLSRVISEIINDNVKVYREDGTDISQDILDGDYDNEIIINSLFNSQDSSFGIDGGENNYLFIRNDQANFGYDYKMILLDAGSGVDTFFKTGDILLVIETDVPDRWFDAYSPFTCFNKLETSKIDLDNYATKTEVNAKSDLTNVAPAYDNTLTYTIGEVVSYNGKIYKCTTAITTPESWDSTHWELTSVASNFVNLTGTQVISGAKRFRDLYAYGQSNASVDFEVGSYTGTIEYRVGEFTFGDDVEQMATISSIGLIPSFDNIFDIGSLSSAIKDIYIKGVFNPNINGYGLTLPNTSNWTADKEIATTDQTFNVINASDIVNNTLTQAQYDLITNGKPTLIKGTFLSMHNAIYFPYNNQSTGGKSSVVVGVGQYNGIVFGKWAVSSSTRILSISGVQDQAIFLQSIYSINGKIIDYYLNNVYPYATNSTTTLQYETINNISASVDTTFTLATAPANTYPEYKANIANSGASDITITLPSGTAIKGNVSISSNTFVITSGSSVELNIQNNRALVVEW